MHYHDLLQKQSAGRLSLKCLDVMDIAGMLYDIRLSCEVVCCLVIISNVMPRIGFAVGGALKKQEERNLRKSVFFFFLFFTGGPGKQPAAVAHHHYNFTLPQDVWHASDGGRDNTS